MVLFAERSGGGSPLIVSPNYLIRQLLPSAPPDCTISGRSFSVACCLHLVSGCLPVEAVSSGN